MAKLPWAGFGPGTDKVSQNRAKAEIWTEQAKFKEHNEKLHGRNRPSCWPPPRPTTWTT